MKPLQDFSKSSTYCCRCPPLAYLVFITFADISSFTLSIHFLVIFLCFLLPPFNLAHFKACYCKLRSCYLHWVLSCCKIHYFIVYVSAIVWPHSFTSSRAQLSILERGNRSDHHGSVAVCCTFLLRFGLDGWPWSNVWIAVDPACKDPANFQRIRPLFVWGSPNAKRSSHEDFFVWNDL